MTATFPSVLIQSVNYKSLVGGGRLKFLKSTSKTSKRNIGWKTSKTSKTSETHISLTVGDRPYLGLFEVLKFLKSTSKTSKTQKVGWKTSDFKNFSRLPPSLVSVQTTQPTLDSGMKRCRATGHCEV
eukprot:sb/3475458/